MWRCRKVCRTVGKYATLKESMEGKYRHIRKVCDTVEKYVELLKSIGHRKKTFGMVGKHGALKENSLH